MDKKTLLKKSVMIIGRSEVGAESSVLQEFASGRANLYCPNGGSRHSPLKETVNQLWLCLNEYAA